MSQAIRPKGVSCFNAAVSPHRSIAQGERRLSAGGSSKKSGILLLFNDPPDSVAERDASDGDGLPELRKRDG